MNPPLTPRSRMACYGALLLSLLCAGCASVPEGPSNEDWKKAQARAAGERVPDSLRPYYTVLYAEGERNRTLNWMRLATAAMQEGQWTVARQALDEAIIYIDSLQAGNEQAEQAKDNFKSESFKPFKGEPYERVMVYLYRGLIFYQEGQYDNAIACCKSGALQDLPGPVKKEGDPVAEPDYQTLYFLECLSWQRLGKMSRAAEAWVRLRKFAPSLPETMPEIGSQTLVVANVGIGPYKVAVGQYRELLAFREPNQSYHFMRMPAGWTGVGDNLSFQAMTRGGRTMDEINRGKAAVKGATDAAGDILLMGGGVAGVEGLNRGDDTVAIAGGAAFLAGLISKAVSSATTPQADIRSWDTLPSAVFLGFGPVPDAGGTVTLRFLNKSHGAEVNTVLNLQTQPQGGVIWAWK
ncbi:MAG: tetratricopeptide repeat protein [Verrucomicrobiae bacterium]|nr:tetratricopeptide repeat protein [Verrucomicrobiae bacterium]